MRTLILVRHAHALANDRDVVSGVPPGEGLSRLGMAQARAARVRLEGLTVDLGVASRFARAQETLRLLAPDAPALVLAGLDEISFGEFEGGPLADYRAWAWSSGPSAPCPGGGESRAAAAARLADAMALLLRREERTVVAVSHSMPIRYLLETSEGRVPGQRVVAVPHAEPFVVDRARVVAAERGLRAWAASPRFANAPDGA